MIGAVRANAPTLAAAAVFALIFISASVAYPNFGSFGVVRNLLVDNAFLGVAAVGATIVILSGGIDLSVGSVMAFTSILIAVLIDDGIHPGAAIGIALACGAAFGAAQGALVSAFSLPPFLVTLGGMFLARGGAFAVHPHSMGIVHPFIGESLNERLVLRLSVGGPALTFPLPVFVFLGAVVVAWVLLRHTRLGRRVHAVGDDAGSAALMGLPIASTRVGVYALSGLCSALAGVLFVLYQQSGDPAACKGLELDAIAAVVIGGTLLRGGVGSVLGTLIGVLTLGVIQTVLTFQGNLSSWWTRIAVGGLVLAFLVLQRLLTRAAQRRAPTH